MCEFCDWKTVHKKVSEMIGDKDRRWAWAYPTISGINQRIKESSHVTERQAQAIINIRGAKK